MTADNYTPPLAFPAPSTRYRIEEWMVLGQPGFHVVDDATGLARFKTTDRTRAEECCANYNAAAREEEGGRLFPSFPLRPPQSQQQRGKGRR